MPRKKLAFEEAKCRLTLPSRGHATSGFACCRPPLMSNVRARKRRWRRNSCKSVSAYKLPRSPWPSLASSTAQSSCNRPKAMVSPSAQSSLNRPRQLSLRGTSIPGNVSLRTSILTAKTHGRFYQGQASTSWNRTERRKPFHRAVLSWHLPAASMAFSMSATSRWSSFRLSVRLKQAMNSRRLWGHGRASPNPSIEGTPNIRLRLLSAAPHVKR